MQHSIQEQVMARLNLRNINSWPKQFLIFVAVFLPLATFGAINTFDKLVGTKLNIDNIQLDGNSLTTTSGDLEVDLASGGYLILRDLTPSKVLFVDSNYKLQSSSADSDDLGNISGLGSSACGINDTCTLTNKSMSGSANTFTNIPLTTAVTGSLSNLNTTADSASTGLAIVARDSNGDFAARIVTAALVGNVTGNLTGNVTGNVTGNLTGNVTGNVSGSSGSTTGNAATATALAANGANCSAGQFPLGVDASGAVESCSTSLSGNASTATALAVNPSACSAGDFVSDIAADGTLTCATPTASVDQPFDITNIGIDVSVASNEMTIALKQSDGSTDCSSGSGACNISYRSVTSGSGGYTTVATTGSLTLVVPSGATLGSCSGCTHYYYVYAINNGGANELAVSMAKWDQGTVQTTTTIGTGADSNSGFYSTTGRTSKPIRVLARIKVTEATAGTWATDAAEISIWPFQFQQVYASYTTATAGSYSTSNEHRIDFSTKVKDTHNMCTTGASFACLVPEDGDWCVSAQLGIGGSSLSGGYGMYIYFADTKLSDTEFYTWSSAGFNSTTSRTICATLTATQNIYVTLRNDMSGTLTLNTNASFNRIDIWKRGDF
jgi:hypothetical protein